MKVCVEASGIQAYGPTDNSQVCRIKLVEQKQSCNESGNTSAALFFKTEIYVLAYCRSDMKS